MLSDGAPEEIRTPDPQIRSLVLYPAELRARRVVAIGFDLHWQVRTLQAFPPAEIRIAAAAVRQIGAKTRMQA